MPQTPPNTRPPTAAELSPLIPLRGLSADLLKVLCRHCDVLSVPKGAHLKQSGKELKYYLFLLQGELLLRDRDGEIQALAGGTVRAGFPLVAAPPSTPNAAKTAICCGFR